MRLLEDHCHQRLPPSKTCCDVGDSGDRRGDWTTCARGRVARTQVGAGYRENVMLQH